MDVLLQFIQGQNWFAVLTSVIALASAIAALTPTPQPGTWIAKLYSVIDFLALNVGQAKSDGQVDVEEEKQ
jgi:hypothetical protein